MYNTEWHYNEEAPFIRIIKSFSLQRDRVGGDIGLGGGGHVYVYNERALSSNHDITANPKRDRDRVEEDTGRRNMFTSTHRSRGGPHATLLRAVALLPG